MPEQPVPSDLPAEPWELRRAAFGALRQILFGLGKTGPLVIFLDDLHWADLDSAVFLGQLLRSASPRGLLLVGCFRSDSIQASPFLRRWSEMRAELHGHVLFDDLELGELDEPESRALARDLLPDPSGPEADGVCERIAAESRGHPIFLAQLARHAATSGTAASLTLEAAVQARLAQLPEPARRLLVTLSAAGHPLAVELAQEAADLPAQERTALAALRGAGLVQPAASGAPGWIEPVHDVIREQALAGISADDRATVHRALARSLRGQGTEAAEDVAHHLIEAGDHRDAAVFVREAAVGAARQLAFERAAELYGLAIELGRDPGDLAALLEGLAEAHLGAGHTQPAGVAFERASVALAALDPADTHDLLRLEQRAAEAFLRGGFIEDGMRLLRLAFARAGVRWPVSERASIASIVASTARLALRPRYSPRGPSRAGGRWQLEADVCFTAWLGTLWCDTLRSLDFQHRYLLYALRSGDPVRTARALVIQAHGIGLLGSKRARRRADTMIRGIRDFVFEVGDPYVDFYWEFGQGSYAIYAGDWAHALRSLEKAHGLGRALGGVAWEQTLIGCYRLWALAYLGDIPRLMAQRAELVEQAAESGELWTSAIGDLAMSVFGALADDDPSGARARTEDALRRLPSTRYQSAHYGAFVCQAWVDLYVGAPDAALARAGAEVTNLKRTRTWDIQRMRTETRLIEGLAELGLARDARDAATRARHLTRSTALARALRRERVPWIDGLAQLLFGLGADLAGEPDLALASLSAAHRRFTERDMHLYAAVTGLRLGARLGGDEGARMTAYSRRWLGGRGVVAIDRLADAMAPARAG